MATADEILSQLATEEDKVLVINNDLRTITIPQTVKMLGVESDEDVLRLHFRMPKTYGETDLSEFVIRINYINAKGIGDIYTVSDTSIVDDTITFSWLISRNATAYKGSVRFIVCLKLYDETGLLIKEYNTTVSSLPVLEGLEVSDIIIEQNPDIIEKILLRLDKLENSGGVNVSGAQVGQTIRVSAVDESGKPTAWEASDFPEQIQSDYNQNDEAAADYVKNRPFYTGDTLESDPIDFIGATWTSTDGIYTAEYEGTGNFPLSVGNGAKLTVDGTEYTGTVEDLSVIAEGMIGFGDVEAVISGDPTAINFAVFGSSYGDMISLYVSVKADVEPTSCTVLGIMQEVKKIEPKYLPGSLLPDSALSGQMMKFKGYSWLPVPDPTEWEFIYGKPIVRGSTEIPCTIKKAYKKILVAAKGIKVSGTKALDIYVSTLPNPVNNYKFSGFCKIPLSAQPALEKSTASFLIIEKLPFQGYLCFVNKTPYNDDDSPQDSNVLITYNKRSALVSQGETESTTLYFGITGDTFNGAGSLALYGIPE